MHRRQAPHRALAFPALALPALLLQGCTGGDKDSSDGASGDAELGDDSGADAGGSDGGTDSGGDDGGGDDGGATYDEGALAATHLHLLGMTADSEVHVAAVDGGFGVVGQLDKGFYADTHGAWVVQVWDEADWTRRWSVELIPEGADRSHVAFDVLALDDLLLVSWRGDGTGDVVGEESDHYFVTAFDLETGAQRWQRSTEGWNESLGGEGGYSAALGRDLAGGFLAAMTSRNGNAVLRVDASGEPSEAWRVFEGLWSGMDGLSVHELPDGRVVACWSGDFFQWEAGVRDEAAKPVNWSGITSSSYAEVGSCDVSPAPMYAIGAASSFSLGLADAEGEPVVFNDHEELDTRLEGAVQFLPSGDLLFAYAGWRAGFRDHIGAVISAETGEILHWVDAVAGESSASPQVDDDGRAATVSIDSDGTGWIVVTEIEEYCDSLYAGEESTCDDERDRGDHEIGVIRIAPKG